jgi:AcrR family transcriptional regulator
VSQVRSRREEYSDSSRQALIDSATRLFAAGGYADTSIDEVAADARLSKGAVYHHFVNKQALFEAVLERLEGGSVHAIATASAGHDNAWDAGMAGLQAFLQHCLDPVYQRLCFIEGPVALGFTCWWEQGEKHEVALIRAMLDGLKAEGLVEPDDLETLTQLLYGSMAAAALAIARADDPAAACRRVQDVIVRMIWGLRAR